MKAAGLNPSIDFSEVAEIELVILRRLRGRTLGDHTSIAKGPGHDFVGTRAWEPADRVSSIDWAQSSLTNFSPIITRDFDQNSRATVLAVADVSLSTRCGAAGLTIADAILRCIATFGLSATLFQDAFGLVLFDQQSIAGSVRARIGKRHLLHCLNAYCGSHPAENRATAPRLVDAIASHLREPVLLPVISDLLFAEAPALIADFARLKGGHDVLLVIPDGRPAFQMPRFEDGWVRIADVETGETQILSQRQCERLTDDIAAWQDALIRQAREMDLDAVKVDLDTKLYLTLASFVAERRGRKV